MTHRYEGMERDSMERSARNLAAWRNAYVNAGFGDKEALRLVRDVSKRHVHQSFRNKPPPHEDVNEDS